MNVSYKLFLIVKSLIAEASSCLISVFDDLQSVGGLHNALDQGRLGIGKVGHIAKDGLARLVLESLVEAVAGVTSVALVVVAPLLSALAVF